jgi:hypothetical protein
MSDPLPPITPPALRTTQETEAVDLGVWEVLQKGGSDKDATARIIAKWMDELICIPGTNFRIGLEPIMAFFPGIGEFFASSLSVVTIVESVRNGVAPSVIGRMGLNMGFNALLGIIPGAGPALSALFKSNTRNLILLRRWQEGEGKELKKGSRLLLYLVVGGVFLIFSALMIAWAFYLYTVISVIRGWWQGA